MSFTSLKILFDGSGPCRTNRQVNKKRSLIGTFWLANLCKKTREEVEIKKKKLDTEKGDKTH